VGLAFLVGTNLAVGIRVLGVGRGLPIISLDRYYLVMWLGFWVNAISGILLLIGYPTKSLTNPLFYVKIGLIAIGLVAAQKIRGQMLGSPGLDRAVPGSARTLAAVSIFSWLAAITAGRFLAYTYSRLMATDL
jgi:hypothetical protein